MGVLSDRLGARLAEMRARHAESDRQLAVAKAEAEAALARWQRSADALRAELAD